MILIIGGAAAGKRDYARSLGYKDAEISKNVWELIDNGDDERLFEELCASPVVICGEVGSGVVPVSREERDRRERCGRLCIQLAARAESVIRVFCGLPTVIK